MKKLSWPAIVANYMVLDNQHFVYIDNVSELYRTIKSKIQQDNLVNKYPQLNMSMQAIFFCLSFESSDFFCSATFERVHALKTFEALEMKYKLDDYITSIITEYAISKRLQKLENSQSISYDVDSYDKEFILFTNMNSNIIQKNKVLCKFGEIASPTEEMLLILKYMVYLKFASYIDGHLIVYVANQYISFKVTKEFIELLLTCC